MTEWYYQPAHKLAQAIKNKQISAIDLLDISQKRIEQVNSDLSAIIATDFTNARKKADAADKAVRNGDAVGPLHGVPITVKDNLEVIGMPCTAASKDFKNHMPGRNADIVDSLQQAGAIVIGKSNLPRLAEDLQTYNELYGQTNNPWDQSKTPGGSSGGSAVAIASGMSALEIGNDIGGSLRIPAHFCGIYGHKPTYGIVPQRGMVPPAPGLFTGDYFFEMDIVMNGPLARSAEDLDLVLDLIVQAKACDRKGWKIELPPARHNKISEFRIGIWPDDPSCPVDKSIENRIREVANQLENAGAIVKEQHPKLNFARNFNLFTALLNAELGLAAPPKVFDGWIAKEAELGPSSESYRNRQIRGAIQRHRDWLMRDAERQLARQKWKEYFDQFDVLLCPSVCTNAFPHDHSSWFDRTIQVNGVAYPYSNLMGWAGLINSVCLPSTIIPVGKDANGLPIGLQIVGPYLEDKTCIQFAALLDELTGGFTAPPGFP